MDSAAMHQTLDYSHLPERFTREMGCDVAYLRSRLPEASKGCEVQVNANDAEIRFNEGGTLALQWHALEPRRIALLNAPRLHVSFNFQQVPLAQRIEYMRYFDLYTRRGGG